MPFCVAVVARRDIPTCLQMLSKVVVLCDRRNTFCVVLRSWVALFVAGAALWWPPLSCRVFRRVVLRAFGESHGQNGVKWWQLANCVARAEHHESVILRGRGSIWCRSKECGKSFCVAGALFQYFGHSTLHTLHLTLHTLHFSTLNFTRNTPHSRLSTLHSTLYTPHSALYTPHFTLHTLHSTLYTSTLYSPHSTLRLLHFRLHTPHFTLYISHSTLYTLHSALFTLHSTLYTSHSALHTLHSTTHL